MGRESSPRLICQPCSIALLPACETETRIAFEEVRHDDALEQAGETDGAYKEQ